MIDYRAISAVRTLKALRKGAGNTQAALAFTSSQGWPDERVVRASIGGTERNDIQNGGGDAYSEWIEAVRPMSLYGRAALRRVPPMTPMLVAVAGTTAHWVREGGAARLSAGSYSRDGGLILRRVAALTAASNEALEAPGWAGEAAIATDLAAAAVQALDAAFIDPNNAGDDDTPASITATVPDPVDLAANAVADLDAGMNLVLQRLVAAGSSTASAYWICSPSVAAWLATRRGSSGAAAYPEIGVMGGRLLGLPVLCSSACQATASDGDYLVLLDGTQIAYADETPELHTSQQASIEMSSTPTGDALVPTGASEYVVSMFQADATALMVTMNVNWKVLRPGMVQILNGLDIEAASL